jgi:hypothetical protein
MFLSMAVIYSEDGSRCKSINFPTHYRVIF